MVKNSSSVKAFWLSFLISGAGMLLEPIAATAQIQDTSTPEVALAVDRTLPETDTATVDRTLPEIDTATVDRTLPETDTAAVDRTLSEIDTATVDRTLSEIDTAAVDRALPETDTATEITDRKSVV